MNRPTKNYRGGGRGYNNNPVRLSVYDVHPVSIKMLMQGNPWVTLDQYSEKFHPKDKFVIALNRGDHFALLLHDPQHKSVRARLWSKTGNFENQIKNFKVDFTNRLDTAFRLRKTQKLLEQRDNFYLTFGEVDKLPGLFIQFIGGEVLIQMYTHFWEKYEDFIIQTITKKMSDVFDLDIFRTQMWKQMRVDGDVIKAPPTCLDPNMSFRNLEITEFGVKYKVNIGKNYDTGIYTDMSSVRVALNKEFTAAKSVLNLYSYTGAFSLFGMQKGADEVVSVDLSEKYLEWLDENIELNEQLDSSKHTSMCMSSSEALKRLEKDEKKFDLIICDPPSSSNDGNRRSNALKDYEKILPSMHKVLSENGKMIVFLNTHKVNRKKFQIKIQEIINFHKLPLKTSTFYGLGEDCPAMPKFPEGSYLKGIKIEVDNDAHKKKEPGDKSPSEVASNSAKKNFNKKTYRKPYEANGNVDPDFKPKKKWPKKKSPSRSSNNAPKKKVTE
jgi:23S rRNA (cytosine1962-C5)-methyltransferase